jgi:hypothetical protein
MLLDLSPNHLECNLKEGLGYDLREASKQALAYCHGTRIYPLDCLSRQQCGWKSPCFSESLCFLAILKVCWPFHTNYQISALVWVCPQRCWQRHSIWTCVYKDGRTPRRYVENVIQGHAFREVSTHLTVISFLQQSCHRNFHSQISSLLWAV